MKKIIFVMCCLVWADMALAKCGNNDENKLCEPKAGIVVKPGSTTMVGWSRKKGIDKVTVEYSYTTTNQSLGNNGVVYKKESYEESWELATVPYEMDHGVILDCDAVGFLTIIVKWWKKKFASGSYQSTAEKTTTLLFQIEPGVPLPPDVGNRLFCDTGTYSITVPEREGFEVKWKTMDGSSHFGSTLTQHYPTPGIYTIDCKYIPQNPEETNCPELGLVSNFTVTILPNMQFFPLYRQERIVFRVESTTPIPCASPMVPHATPLVSLWSILDFLSELNQSVQSVNNGLPSSNLFELSYDNHIKTKWEPEGKVVYDQNGLHWSCFDDVYPEAENMVDYYYKASVLFTLNGYKRPIEEYGVENNPITSTTRVYCNQDLEWIRVKAYKIANDSLPIDTSILGDILHDFPEHCQLTQVLVAEAGQGLDLGPEVRGKALETQYAWQGDLLGYTTEQVHLSPSEMDFTHDNGWSALYELSIKEPNRELTYCSKVVRPGIFNASSNKTMQTRTQAMDAATGLNVYPNPASNRLWFELHEKASIHIFSLEGILMHQAEWNMGKHELSTEDWPAGIYVLQWNNGLTQQAEPLIIQH